MSNNWNQNVIIFYTRQKFINFLIYIYMYYVYKSFYTVLEKLAKTRDR